MKTRHRRSKKPKGTLEMFIKLPKPAPVPLDEYTLINRYLDTDKDGYARYLTIKGEVLLESNQLLAIKFKGKILIIRDYREDYYSIELAERARDRGWICIGADITGWQYESRSYLFYKEVAMRALRFSQGWEPKYCKEEDANRIRSNNKRALKFMKQMEYQYRIRLLDELYQISMYPTKTTQEILGIRNRVKALLHESGKIISLLEEINKLSTATQKSKRAPV